MFEQFEQLIDKGDALPFSQEKLTIYEKAADLAYTHEELFLTFIAKLRAGAVATSLQEQDTLLHHFLWCIDFYDLNEAELQEEREVFMWQFKWFLANIIKFPPISKDKIEFFFEHFKVKCEKYEYSLRAYYKLRHQYALLNGFDDVEENFELWQKAYQDELSDCEACDVQDTMKYLLHKKDYQYGFELAEAIFSEELTCEDVPKTTYSEMIMPLYKAGRIEEAREMQEKGYFKIYKEEHYLEEIAEHVLFLALTNPKKALTIVQKWMPYANQGKQPYGQFKFYLSSWVLAEVCAKQNIACTYSLEFVKQSVGFISDYYDKRNGNNHFEKRVEETFTLLNS